jgi:hypothetical protein
VIAPDYEAYLRTLGGDVAHDLEHIRRVVINARQLAIAEGAELGVAARLRTRPEEQSRTVACLAARGRRGDDLAGRSRLCSRAAV